MATEGQTSGSAAGSRESETPGHANAPAGPQRYVQDPPVDLVVFFLILEALIVCLAFFWPSALMLFPFMAVVVFVSLRYAIRNFKQMKPRTKAILWLLLAIHFVILSLIVAGVVWLIDLLFHLHI